jgi:hypothetical protein
MVNPDVNFLDRASGYMARHLKIIDIELKLAIHKYFY